MRIAYYMPFKPLGHPVPSGDLVIGTELHAHLTRLGHSVLPVSRLRTRWIHWKPWKRVLAILERRRVVRRAQAFRPHVWMTYHSYYKAPDVLGPACSARLGIPYTVFQGIYATRPRNRWTTRGGFTRNTAALRSAAMVFTNKRRDEANLRRLLPAERLCYVAPGIDPEAFRHDSRARAELRAAWGIAEDLPVVLTAAMFRPGVKTEGLVQVIQACRRLRDAGRRLRLAVCGDGPGRARLVAEAQRAGLEDTLFAGRIPRPGMVRYYSAADVFAFPGVREGLGMVYLEAQAASLPVVAHGAWGAGEVVVDGVTGWLSDPQQPESFAGKLGRLLEDPDLRHRMGAAAAAHVRLRHNLEVNYRVLNEVLERVAGLPEPGRAP